MRLVSLAVLTIALSAVPAYAQDLQLFGGDGSPAVIAQGDSSTTVNLLGGSVSATVSGEGGLSVLTSSGTVNAEGNLGVAVGGLDVSVGGKLPNISVRGRDEQDEPASWEVSPERQATVSNHQPDINGSSVAATNTEGCAVPAAIGLGFSDIRTAASDGVSIISGCGGQTLSDEQRMALAQNSSLTQALAGHGYRLDDVIGLGAGGQIHSIYVQARR